jgi:hypothetical protein
LETTRPAFLNQVMLEITIHFDNVCEETICDR